jgi:glyoxylase I family protein
MRASPLRGEVKFFSPPAPLLPRGNHFDQQGITHGEIKTLAGFGIYVLPFRDPDNIQIELTAPIA